MSCSWSRRGCMRSATGLQKRMRRRFAPPGGRVVAVGTTSVRTVESAWRDGAMSGETDIFIYPGVAFRRVGALLTNFHLPRSSLLLLVCAFAGTELAMEAYRHSVEFRYRFYSYGDCMLIV